MNAYGPACGRAFVRSFWLGQLFWFNAFLRMVFARFGASLSFFTISSATALLGRPGLRAHISSAAACHMVFLSAAAFFRTVFFRADQSAPPAKSLPAISITSTGTGRFLRPKLRWHPSAHLVKDFDRGQEARNIDGPYPFPGQELCQRRRDHQRLERGSVGARDPTGAADARGPACSRHHLGIGIRCPRCQQAAAGELIGMVGVINAA